MVTDSENESISSVAKGKKSKQIDTESVASIESESVRSEDFDYTQADGTQLDPYQQGPLQQEHEIEFQSDSEDEDFRRRI